MRYAPECSDGANAGLSIIQDMLKPVRAKHPHVSTADLWTLAGAYAVQAMGGPEVGGGGARRAIRVPQTQKQVPHRLGRTDDADGQRCPANGRLPDASKGADHLRDVFYRMGFNDQEIVALSGAHTLGRCHVVRR